MINRLAFAILVFFLAFDSAQGQKKIKPDLYLYFKIDSSKYIYKTHIKSQVNSGSKHKPKVDKEYDIYNYSYVSEDRKTLKIFKLFSSIINNKYLYSDSSIFSKHTVKPYRNLEKINGLISYEWIKIHFAFDKVFIVEQIQRNKFKITQVQLYYPFDSNGYFSKPLE